MNDALLLTLVISLPLGKMQHSSTLPHRRASFRATSTGARSPLLRSPLTVSFAPHAVTAPPTPTGRVSSFKNHLRTFSAEVTRLSGKKRASFSALDLHWPTAAGSRSQTSHEQYKQRLINVLGLLALLLLSLHAVTLLFPNSLLGSVLPWHTASIEPAFTTVYSNVSDTGAPVLDEAQKERAVAMERFRRGMLWRVPDEPGLVIQATREKEGSRHEATVIYLHVRIESANKLFKSELMNVKFDQGLAQDANSSPLLPALVARFPSVRWIMPQA